MKRFFLCLALGAGLLSCSESLTTRTSAGLAGTYDVALAGRYLFVTSSDRNELRVLDLEASPRDFVKAPNPLEALSIPVLERPSNLTRDVVYAVETLQKNDGTVYGRRIVQDAGAPLVYARSFGSREISVITADDPALFKERQRLVGQGLITAFAARGPVHTRTQRQMLDADGNFSGFAFQDGSEAINPTRASSVLYYAEQSGLNARLYRRDMAKDAPELLDLALPGSTVTALLVLPPSADQPGQDSLVIATRSTLGSGGETFRVEVNNTQVTRGVTYAFGAPVRALATHTLAEIAKSDWYECSFDPERRDADNKPVPPDPLVTGQYVFGILDESACGSQQTCSGVAAVDSATGAYAHDPVRAAHAPHLGGLGAAHGADDRRRRGREHALPAQERAHADRPHRAAPAGGHRPVLQRGHHPLRRGEDAAVRSGSARCQRRVLPDQQRGHHPDRERARAHRHCHRGRDADRYLPPAVRTGPARAVARGPDGGRVSLGPSQGTCLEISADTSQVELGDVVVLRNESGTTCKDHDRLHEPGDRLQGARQGGVRGRHDDPRRGQDRPRGAPGRLPGDDEAGRPRQEHAPLRDHQRWQGLSGPDGGGRHLRAPGTYYSHPVSVLEPAPKNIVIKTTRGVARGDQYIINANSHFLPYIFSPDVSSTTAGLATYRLPGSVVYSRVGGTDLAYIAYPSADGILQVALETITDNAANTTGLVPFE